MGGGWPFAGRAAASLRAAGAEAIVICTNTMHKVADAVEQASGLPLIHIADATALQVRQQNIRRIGLLGTRFTMEQDFYRGRLQDKFAIEVVTPDAADRDIVHRIIYEELCLGKIVDTSRDEYRRIIAKLEQQGAEGIIFGCTEIACWLAHKMPRCRYSTPRPFMRTPLPSMLWLSLHAEAGFLLPASKVCPPAPARRATSQYRVSVTGAALAPPPRP
ncbi:putative racemase [Serratia fonticola]|uniref:Putative racemase n=1 Tax=Serratia fonticola TaxID=47917 RepID=A0A4V6KQR3_SERFO|nr:putative racemase [Serratia fonticola]